MPDDAASDDDRDELVRLAIERGATEDDLARTTNLGELILDLTLRPRSSQTVGDVVRDAGIDWDTAARLLTSTGLPVDPAQPVTAEEADTIRLFAYAATELLGIDATVQLGRVTGTAMARLAEALVTALRLRFELPRRDSGARDVDVVMQYADISTTLLPGYIRSLDVLLRQQIVAVVDRMWNIDDDRSIVTLPRAIGFVDIVGYTARAATLSVRELADVLVAFDERTAAAALRHRGQILKTIGDEAMFVTERPLDACLIGLELVDTFGTGDLPPVRVGIAAGDVVSMFGDVYGPEVNLAARLVAAAEPSTVVVSTAVAVDVREELCLDELPPLSLKGFPAPVTAYRATAR